MQEISLEQWAKCLAILDLKEVKRYGKQLGITEDTLSVYSQLQFALVDWLSHLGIFTDAVILEIIRTLCPCIEGLSVDFEDNEEVSVFTVAICDSRWVSCSRREKFFDAETFEDVEELPEYGVTHIMCDVIQLYSRMHYRLVKIESTPSTEAEHA
jgi:hypothetical protein|tara:strand:+ start:440 stop:904 length:465 start_codon:yes stop_codon:yes gene_type:complete